MISAQDFANYLRTVDPESKIQKLEFPVETVLLAVILEPFELLLVVGDLEVHAFSLEEFLDLCVRKNRDSLIEIRIDSNLSLGHDSS